MKLILYVLAISTNLFVCSANAEPIRFTCLYNDGSSAGQLEIDIDAMEMTFASFFGPFPIVTLTDEIIVGTHYPFGFPDSWVFERATGRFWRASVNKCEVEGCIAQGIYSLAQSGRCTKPLL